MHTYTERASDESTEVSSTKFNTAAEQFTDNDVSDSNLAQLRKRFYFAKSTIICIPRAYIYYRSIYKSLDPSCNKYIL
jgi:hypothetical protein